MKKLFIVLILLVFPHPVSAQNVYSQILNKALQESNPRICDQLLKNCFPGANCEGTVRSCYSSYSQEAKDVSACALQKDPASVNSCYHIYAHEHLDMNACDRLINSPGVKSWEYGKCVSMLQHEAGRYREDYCLKIRDYDKSSKFFSHCIYRLVQQTKNTSFCDKYKHALQHPYGNHPSCLKMAGDSYPPIKKPLVRQQKDAAKKAVATSNPDVCAQMGCHGQYGQYGCENMIDSCYLQYTIDSKDLNGCRKIKNPSQKSVCYIMHVKATKDVSVCQELRGQVNIAGYSFEDACRQAIP